MAMDLDKLSSDYEDALERSRLLVERRQQASIHPLHLLYVVLESDASVRAMLDKAGIQASSMLDSIAKRFSKIEGIKLESGRRPTASRPLRELIEKSFAQMEARGAERAEPIDFVLAVVDSKEETFKDVQDELRSAGVTPKSLEKVAETRAASEQTLGEKKPAAAMPGAGKALERYGRNLTAAAAAGELMPVIGRDDETRRVIQTLLRKTKSNPVLVGDPGTGKTAVAEGLALRIAAGDVPDSLKKC
jgi:ATP-dependent Clp protease ATP-binding subunit ClpB